MKYLHFLLLLFLPSLGLGMTVEEKVGQVLMAYFDGEEVNAEAKRLIEKTKIGGIIYYNWSNQLVDPVKIQKMSADLQALASNHIGIPLLISTDQEGGLVARLQKGFTEFPGNGALGRTKCPRLAMQASYFMGLEMRAVGINFNLAPVVDVNSNPKNPVIGIRSYGDDKEWVKQMGEASVEGYEQAGVIPCLKHFPGHGDVSVDTHRDLPVITRSLSEIDDIELYPYKELIGKIPAIMTAHILFADIDPVHCATLSKPILQGLLREKLHFNGVIITDSLTMKGVLKNHNSLEEVAIQAFEAGSDILLFGGKALQNQAKGETNVDEIIRVHRALVDAVKRGQISEERLNASVSRILALKERISPSTDLKPLCEAHAHLAREIAYRALNVQKWDSLGNLADQHVLILAPKLLEKKIKQTDLMNLGKTTTLRNFEDPIPSADVVLFCSYNAWKNNKQLELLKTISSQKPTICIATRDPYDLDQSENQALIKMATYSPTACSLQVAAEWLHGKTEPFLISKEAAEAVGAKIWYNECRNRVDQLTFWSQYEPFPSLGIGHFIWPPENYQGIFSRGRFHSVIAFMEKHQVKVPPWLQKARFSPWNSRETFYDAFHTERMEEFRAFLVATIPYQALYMVERLNRAYKEVILEAPVELRQRVTNQFFNLIAAEGGVYVLVDYLNFKHEGTDPNERYLGQGWGLLQVLLEMSEELAPKAAFAEAAHALLKRRVANAPNPEKEAKWLPGWSNRLKSYTQ